MTDTRIDQQIDLRGVPCPMNFVRTQLALDDLEIGQVLEVLLDDGNPVANVARSLADAGQEVLAQTPAQPGQRLLVKKVIS